jgi:hypothetical protein
MIKKNWQIKLLKMHNKYLSILIYLTSLFILISTANILINFSSIEKFIVENLNELFEEARIIFMSKLNKADYEKKYLRDSNNYIKRDAK